MADLKPILQVLGADGKTDLIPQWGNRLIGVKLVTHLDPMNDEATFMFSNSKPYLVAPPINAAFTVSIGWDRKAMGLTGVYYLQRIHLLGNPRQGDQVHYICRSGRMRDEFNQVGSEHFDETTGHKTLGDVFKGLFPGIDVKVSPSIANVPLPGGYHLRWNETGMDSASDLARDNRAVVKVMGSSVVVLAMDLGENVAGTGYGDLVIEHDTDCYEYDVETEARFSYSGMGVTWFNKDEGRLKTEASQGGGGQGQSGGYPHPSATQDSAQALGQNLDAEWGREECTGLFVVRGRPDAVAGRFVRPSGFPDPIDSAKLQADTVTHDIVPDVGWATTIEVKQIPD